MAELKKTDAVLEKTQFKGKYTENFTKIGADGFKEFKDKEEYTDFSFFRPVL